MTVVDGTLGGGGHTRLLADIVGPTGKVIAIDRDPSAIERGAKELKDLPIRFAQANFCNLPEVLDAVEVESIDGMLLDVGISSDQLADREIQRVLVEGGPTTVHRFLEKGLVDEVFLIHSEVVHQEPVEAGLDAQMLAQSGLTLAQEYVWGEERVEHYLRTPTSA